MARSMNLYRRHLNESQRAMVAAALLEPFEREAKGEKIKSGKEHGISQEKVTANFPQPKKRKPEAVEKAGKALGVSGRSVRDAKVVREGAHTVS